MSMILELYADSRIVFAREFTCDHGVSGDRDCDHCRRCEKLDSYKRPTLSCLRERCNDPYCDRLHPEPEPLAVCQWCGDDTAYLYHMETADRSVGSYDEMDVCEKCYERMVRE